MKPFSFVNNQMFCLFGSEPERAIPSHIDENHLFKLCRTLLEFLDPEYHEVDVEEAWVIFRDITKGVQRIHRSGVIHRDLKPQNIFFGYADSRAIKIGDFGHACWAKQYANGEVGTPNRGTTIYCAPELNEETCVTEKVSRLN
jgi:serine/threonine protein kinase